MSESEKMLHTQIALLERQIDVLRTREKTLQERVRALEAQGTAQSQSDQEIIRLERQHALEEMAHGVAHNFNNVLVGVLGYAQIIEMQSEDPRAIENAGKIVENAMRARDLVQKLNLSVREAGELPLHRITRLHTIVKEAIKATQPQWKDSAEARGVVISIVEDQETVPPIKGNPLELHHVLVHLITNAIDAMPTGGEIAISTRVVNSKVAISVSDQGLGMDEEIRKRIFEPFFTTKQDVGSGLGLSMAYRAVTAWGGKIEVISAPDEGSTFTVCLPVWEESDPFPPESEPEIKRSRVLIVDDENAVQEILKETLSEYDLSIFLDAEGVLDAFEVDAYDVALIDLRLPGITGDELTREIRKADPNVVTVLMTGWEVLDNDDRLDLFDFRIQKPFRLNEIKKVVQKAVAQSEQRSET
ncbi:MAG: ATP-binding protein [Candidatus Latescibacteria bacterium]|nr:ATP-binding protein [Candidatus Latescibacterota bacterium]